MMSSVLWLFRGFNYISPFSKLIPCCYIATSRLYNYDLINVRHKLNNNSSVLISRFTVDHLIRVLGLSDGPVVRTVRCKPPGCGFEFKRYRYFWNMFPLVDGPRTNVSQVWPGPGQQNSAELCFRDMTWHKTVLIGSESDKAKEDEPTKDKGWTSIYLTSSSLHSA